MTFGWESTQLGDVLRLEYGKPLPDEDRCESGRYGVYGANGEKARSNRYYHDKPSIVVGRKGSAGGIKLTGEKFWPLDVTYFATFDESRYDLKFLYHLLGTLDLPSMARGVKPGINRNDVYSLSVRVPPLAEQHRIVAILDEAFAGIVTAKANAEKNLRNARAIVDMQLRAIFTACHNEWPVQPLISLCSLFVDSAHRTPKYQEDGIPALRPRDVVNGRLNLSRVGRVSIDEYEIQSKRHKPSAGDIVYSRELSFGWAAILPKNPRVCLSQGMCVFRPLPSIDADFLLYALNGPYGREQAIKAAVGTSHPHINLGDIKSYTVPLPPLDSQKKTVHEVRSLSFDIKQLESLYTRKLAALDALKQSLLQRAFAGEL